MTDGGMAHRFVLEQAFDHLHAHLAIQAVDRLGRGIAEHAKDAVGVVGHRLPRLVDIEHDLRAAQHHTDNQCG
ncbi:hypothetical protein D3C78_1358340 [compost metagenome]